MTSDYQEIIIISCCVKWIEEIPDLAACIVRIGVSLSRVQIQIIPSL